MYKQPAKKLEIKSERFLELLQTLNTEKMLYNSFVLSNLNYCPMIWMFSGKSSSNEINRIHKRPLRVLVDVDGSSFEELQQERGEHTIHTRNLRTLLLEAYKCLTSENPFFPWDLLERRPTNYNLRIKDPVQLPNTITVRYGLN